jgi:hypothetical protein
MVLFGAGVYRGRGMDLSASFLSPNILLGERCRGEAVTERGTMVQDKAPRPTQPQRPTCHQRQIFLHPALRVTIVPLSVTGFARATSPPPFGGGEERSFACRRAHVAEIEPPVTRQAARPFQLPAASQAAARLRSQDQPELQGPLPSGISDPNSGHTSQFR